MLDRRTFISSAAATAVAGCSRAPEVTRAYTGPEITHIEVRKSDRVMYLWSSGKVIRAYRIDLGFQPSGRKRFEGDGKTPEGDYFIDRRNPESQFYLSLGISYPNRRDIDYAHRFGRTAGGDIFIHGDGKTWLNRSKDRSPDWTAGCIALSNPDMTELWTMIRLGTPITIRS